MADFFYTSVNFKEEEIFVSRHENNALTDRRVENLGQRGKGVSQEIKVGRDLS